MGKFLAGLVVVAALAAGGGLYYLQVYHFYEEVTADGTTDVQLTARATGAPEPVSYDGFRAIDADSSPIRYRACFTTPLAPGALQERYAPYARAEPLTAPGWFDCYDAQAIGAALEGGRAHAYLGEENIRYGIDRVIAITEDGRGYVWHQINRCGEVVFDGRPAPEGCPAPPEGY